MLLVIDNFEQFKIFFEVIYDITELIELQLFKTHMFCTILDKARVRFMSVRYDKEFFSIYDVGDGERVTIFAEDLFKIIKSANKIDTVSIETTDDHMVCKIESNTGNSRIFEFVLPADYIESPQPPSLPQMVKFNMKLDDIKQSIKDLKIIGSGEIMFVVNNNEVNILAGVETSTKYSSNIHTDVSTDEQVSSRYSIDYIEQLLKFNKISKVITMNIGNDFPLIYSLSDVVMGVTIDGMIAPRMEDV